MIKGDIPHILLEQLNQIEPDVEFMGNLPKVRSSSGKEYFVKCGTSAEREQYIGEVESLKAIEAAAPGLAPRVLSSGQDEGRPFLLSEYKDLGRLDPAAAKVLAKRLAEELHVYESEKGYGFHVPTYCGATRLRNGWFETWEICFSSMMKDLLDQLKGNRQHEELCSMGEEVIKSVIPKLLGPLKIDPVLLHGDLWRSGEPIIFDPSSFYGHCEADLAISRMFGGFPPVFYTTYHELQPKSDPVDQYSYRCDLYELFHYLNHTLLFGASYEQSAKQKMNSLLGWAKKSRHL
ncbi:fructosamine kinase PKL/CAK/FruK [Lyophyllum atratum]|nr:fructosamine kinase PKL/CAK/FruK [Lyophyllum atratum]